jgi:hypothetical protein
MSDNLFMQPENICDVVIDLTVRFTERASFFLAGAGLGYNNPELTLATGAFGVPMSVETGRLIGIDHDDYRSFVDSGLIILGYGTSTLAKLYSG